jgi:hypothetical protein
MMSLRLIPAGIRSAVLPGRQCCAGHLAVHVNRAAHRLDDAKLHQKSVASVFDDAASMLLDLGVGQVAPQRLQRL